MRDIPPENMSERIVPNPPSLYNEADEAYREHLLEQYKHFVEMTMKYWGHIETANQFFLSLHTVILSGFTYLLTSQAVLPAPVFAMLVLIACALALQWLMVLRSLQRLNQVRHAIIQEWEAHFAAQPYRVECYKLYGDKGPRYVRYFRIQKLYMLVPLLVFLAYLIFGILITLEVKLVSA